MIQRIQTIYFLLASLLSATGFILPVYRTIDVAKPAFVLEYTLADTIVVGMPVAIAYAAAIIIPLIALLLYKNRPLQMRMGRVGIFISTAALALLVMHYGNASKITAVETVPALGMFLPVGSILFLFLAVRAIKKDDALVRSADRIR